MLPDENLDLADLDNDDEAYEYLKNEYRKIADDCFDIAQMAIEELDKTEELLEAEQAARAKDAAIIKRLKQQIAQLNREKYGVNVDMEGTKLH